MVWCMPEIAKKKVGQKNNYMFLFETLSDPFPWKDPLGGWFNDPLPKRVGHQISVETRMLLIP